MVIAPSDMIALGDARMYELVITASGRAWTAGLLEISPYPSHTAMANAADQARHDGHHNVEFCDGHIEYIKLEPLYAPTQEARKRWNKDDQPHNSLWVPNP
jgi:prepilin-type processing-associated H-X9-DG protein